MDLRMPNPRSLGLKSPSRMLACIPPSPYDAATPSSHSLISDLKTSFVLEQPSAKAVVAGGALTQTPLQPTNFQVRLSPTPSQRSKSFTEPIPVTSKTDPEIYIDKQEKKIQELFLEVKNLRSQLARARTAPATDKFLAADKGISGECKENNAPPKLQNESKKEEILRLRRRMKELEAENQSLRSENDILKAEKAAWQKEKATRKQQQTQMQKMFPESTPHKALDDTKRPKYASSIPFQPALPSFALSDVPQPILNETKGLNKEVNPVHKVPEKVVPDLYSHVKSRVFKTPKPKVQEAIPSAKAQTVRSQSTRGSRHSYPSLPQKLEAAAPVAVTATAAQQGTPSGNCRIYVAREYYIDPATGQQIQAADFESIASQLNPPPGLLAEINSTSEKHAEGHFTHTNNEGFESRKASSNEVAAVTVFTTGVNPPSGPSHIQGKGTPGEIARTTKASKRDSESF